MMTSQKLRQKLIKVLGDELGTYTLSSGQIIPAVSIAKNRPFPEAGTIIQGLEAVIYYKIDSDTQGLLGGKLIAHETRIVLNQWDLDDDTLLAHDLLIAGLPEITRVGPRVMADGAKQTIESRAFYLREGIVINSR